MKSSTITTQIQHFEKYRELKDVPKESVEDAPWIPLIADSLFRSTQKEDNDYRDYDPLYRRILRWERGKATSATFQIKAGERHLERTDVLYGRRYLYRIHQDANSLDFLDTLTDKDGNYRIECWHLDFANPEASFYQYL